MSHILSPHAPPLILQHPSVSIRVGRILFPNCTMRQDFSTCGAPRDPRDMLGVRRLCGFYREYYKGPKGDTVGSGVMYTCRLLCIFECGG